MVGPRPAILPPGTVWLEGAALKARAPNLAAGGAIWAPDEAQVENRAMARALTKAFVRAGGKLLKQTEVIAFGPNGVESRENNYEADAVIMAAGPWSGLLSTGIPVTPVKGQILEMNGPLGSVPLDQPVIWGHGIYLVPRDDDRLLIGATVEDVGFDTRRTKEARDRLRAGAETLFPHLNDWVLVGHRAGLRPRSPDGLPLLGRLANGVFVAAGQYRNGILFAPAIADHLRDLVLGRAEIIPEFDPRRFK